MSKAVLAIFLTLMVTSFAMTFDEAKGLIENDQCATKVMTQLQSQIEAKVTEMKENPNNLAAKAELSALIEQVKAAYDSCDGQKTTEPVLGDPIKAAGVGFLLASNCFKDVGVLLLIVDTIVQDPTNVANDIIVLIITFIMGRQGYADCEQFIHYIR